jgi:hypothetical protein
MSLLTFLRAMMLWVEREAPWCAGECEFLDEETARRLGSQREAAHPLSRASAISDDWNAESAGGAP